MTTSRLYVKNLPANWNEFDVYRLFKGYGHVQDVHLPPIKPDFTSRYGFVEMRTPSEALNAKEKLDGIEMLDSLDEVPADFRLSAPLQVDWCQENYRKGRARSPYRKRQDSWRSFGSRSSAAAPDSCGTTPVLEMMPGGSPSSFPRQESSPETAEVGLDEKQKLNSSAESWATGEIEANSKSQRNGSGQRSKRFGRFNSDRHVPVFINSLKRTFMEPGRETQVLVTHVEAPNEFFVILGRKVGDMCHFHDSMSKFYSGTSPLRYCPTIGEVCVAEYVMKGETLWFRVAVIDNSRKKRYESDIPDRFECLFLDRGFRAWIDKEKVRPIDKKFQEEPVEAVHCGLYGIQPKSEEGRRAKWSIEAMKVFADLVDAADSITTTLMEYCGGKCLVELKLKGIGMTSILYSGSGSTLFGPPSSVLVSGGCCAVFCKSLPHHSLPLAQTDMENKTAEEVDSSKELISRNLAEVVGTGSCMADRNHPAFSLPPNKVIPVLNTTAVCNATTTQAAGLKKFLRVGDLKEANVPVGKNILLSVTRVSESGEVFVVSVEDEKTDDYLENGLLAVERSHNANHMVPGFRPRAGDVVTYKSAQSVYSRGLVLDRPLVPEKVWVENLETGKVCQIPEKDAHPAEMYIGEWPPCRIKCRLKKGHKLPDSYEKRCIGGMLNMKKNGEYELAVVSKDVPLVQLE